MSGIAGIVYPDLFQMNDLIKPMVKTLKHRCLEEPAIHTYKNIQIGGCGSQTAYSRNKSIFCAIDGTLTNSKEIAQAMRMKSTSHAELVLKAYELLDTKFLEKIEGDFAIAILDQNKKKLLLARDRIGRRPLYWFQDNHHFIFASELKAILSTGAVPQTAAIDALSAYLFFGYIPQDMSPIKGINKLLPAHFLQLHLEGSKTIESYWSYSSYFEHPTKGSKEQILGNLSKIFESSIKQCLPNKEEKIGCFMSGGLGSASVAHYLKKLSKNDRILSYSVGFLNENEGDIEAAKLISSSLNIPQETYKITQDTFANDLVKINWYLDEPIADLNVVATWKLCEMASKNTKTVFSGMGSDELFAGHSRYTTKEQDASLIRQIALNWLHRLQRALIPIMQRVYKPFAYELMKESRTDPLQSSYLKANAYFDEAELAKASPKLRGIFDPEVFLHKFHHLFRVQSTVASYLYFDVKTRLVDCYIHQYERLTTAHQIDWQSPFLNRGVVEYLASLPEPNFLKEEEAAGYLKSLMENSLPDQIIQRPKRTRQLFLKSWMENSPMKDLFLKLPNGTLVDNGLVSQNWLKDQINHLGYANDTHRKLWSILQLEIWFRLFINRPIDSKPPEITVSDLLDEPA
ncbi:putative asparagine synthase [Waddlia chondrophila 2032/99]|uniref:asparagine synthase (glutamine-hydrolyzing) n=2 Tax=Waddlia chondrophila TaxID=71667 RepID=D6YVY5_WADCW|nr:asparagine synthase-related protein [Waddlia chondrophila]ADI38296.1 putative asparagine synthase [Waddlia chondrophila WSU 86-1044]CCB91377.1 putative asparagine synthase [Waddlia chondrophila 2032/99]